MGKKIAFIVFGLLIAAAIYSFFSLYERIEETIDTGPGKEARKNPYLAANQYLDALGVENESSTEMTLVDRLLFGETLFITNASTVRSQERKNQLLDWVDQGGRLILAVSEEDIAENAGLIAELGIEVDYIAAAYPKFRNCTDLNRSIKRPRRSSDNTEEESIAEMLEEFNRQSSADNTSLVDNIDNRRPEECVDRKYLTQMDFSEIDAPFYVHFPGAVGLSWDDDVLAEPFYYAEDEAGIRFAQLEWGGGLISIMSSPEIWQSDRIGLFDNAYLISALSEKSSRFHILYGSAMPSLLKQIWRSGYEFVFAAMIAILLWIWHVGKRIVPFRDPVVTQRRSVLEHLEARGDYLWKYAEYDALINPLKDDILQRCKIRFPAFHQAGPEAQIEFISTTCHLDIENVKQLFSPDGCDTALQCQQAIRIAQQIRNKL